MSEHHNTNHDAGNSIVLGFILSVGNHFFGWLNKITITEGLNEIIQAVITGFIGATVAYFTTKFWRKITGDKSQINHFETSKSDKNG